MRRRRASYAWKAAVVAKGLKDMDVYEMYADFREPLKRMAGHRVLAVNRGEREEFLKVMLSLTE